MIRVSLRSLFSHKLRLILTCVAIMLGVSFVAGTIIVTDTINTTFNKIFQDANAGVAVTVHGHEARVQDSNGGPRQTDPVPTSLLPTVRGVPGVKNAVGEWFRNAATLLDSNGKEVGVQGPPKFGGNWINDSEISPFHLRSGAPPSQPTDVVIDANTAKKYQFAIGQKVSISFNGGAKEQFTISGITGFGSSDTLAGATIALFTEPTAARVLEAQGKYDAIQASAVAGTSDVTLRDRVAKVLPTYAEAETGQQAAAAAEQATSTFINTFIGTFLGVFAFIALFVGSFLILNTFNILVAQRTRELALLRALGATRRQVLTSVLVEAALTGVFASALGSLLGILIAIGLTNLFGASEFGLTLHASPFVTAIVVGTIVTVLAATLPARRATRIPPVAALREALPEIQSLPKRRIITGAVILVLGCVGLGFALFGKTNSTLQLLGAGMVAVFVGVSLLAPMVVRPIALVLGYPIRSIRGAAGRLAGENARRNPRRTSLTAAALMIGIALVTAVAVILASVKASIDSAIVGALRADFIVFTQGQGFTSQTADRFRADHKLKDVSELRIASVLVDGARQDLAAIDPAALGKTFGFNMTDGGAGSIGTNNTAVVDAVEAKAHNLHVGDAITVGFNSQDVTMHIGGIYKQNAFASGYIVSVGTLQPNVPTQRDQVMLLNAADGVSVADAEASLKSDLKDFPLLLGMSRQEYRDFIGTQLDSALNLIYVLLGFALLIALLGILNTLALSVLERTRELGLLRALGMTRFQTSEMVGWESVIVSLMGAVLGIAVGLGLGLAATGALHDGGIDQTAVPGASLVTYAVVAALFGIVAAILPAIRASRVDVLRAITTE